MSILYKYIIYFFVYAFLGWVCESIYCSVGNKRIINRGFLNGPLCPIYGIGALVIILLLQKYKNSVVSVFTIGLIITSILEYITGYILEKLFNTKWWDYSKRPFNINGRVCIKNSVLFGILSVVVVEIIHPQIIKYINSINITYIFILTISLSFLLLIDIVMTIYALNKLSNKLDNLENVIQELKKINMQIKIEKFTENNLSKIQKRLLNAFPNMNHRHRNEGLKYLKQILRDKDKK